MVRVPPDLLTRLDAYRETLGGEDGSGEVSRPEAVRRALAAFLGR